MTINIFLKFVVQKYRIRNCFETVGRSGVVIFQDGFTKHPLMSKRSSRQSRNQRNIKRSKHKSAPAPQYQGIVRMTREGFIFVSVADLDEDIYVRAAKTRHALHGDTVEVALTKQEKKEGRKYEGEVVRIVERNRRPFVGIFHTAGKQAWVLMQSRTMPYDIEVDKETATAAGAEKGMKVAAIVDDWKRNDSAPVGHIVDVLGVPGENNTEMHAILAEYGLPYRFEPEVENAADNISDKITAEDLKGRRDFRDVITLTIDPADAKDFDDALSFRMLDNGNFEVGIHIADVSYYVRPGNIVDEEAQARGTSVYLVDRTVPMLPEKLCNKLCSLRPHEEKLTFSVVCEITPRGKIENRWFGRTVINSDERYTYEQAQAIIEASLEKNATMPESATDQAIVYLHKLATLLRKKRFAAGAINFERPEMKVECDETGKPVRIYQKISKEANWLIEEFMLLANRSVAEFIATAGKMNGKASSKAKSFIYRIHATPNPEKLENLRNFAAAFGYKVGNMEQKKEIAKSINALMAAAKDKPEFNAFEMLALRSMAKACYSTDNIGHYGLAFDFYTHFTSPIRRYPDTMVHRLLAMYLDGEPDQDKGYYEMQCRYASEREQIATDAERASIKYKLVEYMQEHVGEEYEGGISGLTEWGMYVEVDPTKIEGMVSMRDIKSDFFEFDEEQYRLVGRRTHKIYRLGDRVRIRVKSANLEQKLLDYELVEDTENTAPDNGDSTTEDNNGKAPAKARRGFFGKSGKTFRRKQSSKDAPAGKKKTRNKKSAE